MRNPKLICPLCLLIFFTLTAFCQEGISKIKPLMFRIVKTDSRFVIRQYEQKTFFAFKYSNFSKSPTIKPLEKEVHYPAFFCKMELRTLDRCNVRIKIHAGDYDRYSKIWVPN